MCDMMFV